MLSSPFSHTCLLLFTLLDTILILFPSICIIFFIVAHKNYSLISLLFPYFIKNSCLIETYIILCNKQAIKTKNCWHSFVIILGIVFNGTITFILFVFLLLAFQDDPVDKNILIGSIFLIAESSISTFTSILSYVVMREIVGGMGYFPLSQFHNVVFVR